MFAQFSMFLDQHGGKEYNSGVAASFKPAFKDWLVGYVVVSSRGGEGEEWTIKRIESEDSKPHRDNCEVTLINDKSEIRQVKGSTLQSGYAFKSSGDVGDPAPEARSDVQPLGVNPDGVREFYPRKNAAGTRILMHDKTTYIVAESFTEVWNRFKLIGAHVAQLDNKPTGVIDANLTHNG